MICFAKLASKWPELMRTWEDVEESLPALQMSTIKKGELAYKIRVISTLILTLSLGTAYENLPKKIVDYFRPPYLQVNIY